MNKGSSWESWNANDYRTLPPALPSHSPPKSFHPFFLRNSPLMGTTSPPADIVTGEHLAGAHKQIELEISPGPLISEDLEHVWHRAPLTKSPRVSIPRFWGAGGKAGEGRYGPEASQAPRWSLFNKV